MEENRYENDRYERDNFFYHHPILKHLLYGLLGLIGAFLAFYVVTDWYFKAMLNPVHQMKRMDRAIERRDREMEKTFQKAFKGSERLEERANQVIRLEQKNDEYKILVDLVPLNNDDKNVDVKVNGNILTVKAAGIHGIGNKKSIVEFTQSYMFGDDVDLKNITKERKGDTYVITVPID